MTLKTTLKSLIRESKDGEWGEGESFDESVEMLVVRGTDIDEVRFGNIENVPIRYIPKRIAERKSLVPNDIIFETAGGSIEKPTGRSVFLKPSLFQSIDLPLTCASFSRFIRINPDKANPYFVFWLLQHLYNTGHLYQYHVQHTGVARFQYTDFATMFGLSLPSTDVQDKTAHILSIYDDLIENNLRRIRILEEMAQLLYREWFVKFRIPGHEKVKVMDSPLGKIPEGWEVKTVGECIERYQVGKKYDQRTVSETGVVPVLDQGRSGIIGYHDDEPGFIASENKPVIVFANHTCYQRIVLYPFSAIQNVLPFLPNPTLMRSIYWLHWATKDVISFNEYKGHWPEFISKELLVPPAELTNQFGEITELIVRKIYKMEQKNSILRQTRDLLLPKLISGQLDVSELEIDIGEPAA